MTDKHNPEPDEPGPDETTDQDQQDQPLGRDERVTLHPLSPEEALRRLLRNAPAAENR